MRRALLLVATIPFASYGQVALSAVNGTAESQVTSLFDFGKVGIGDAKDVLFRARNTGSSKVTVTTLSLSGAGFTFVNPPSVPFTIAPENFQELTVHFAGGAAATYSSNFQLNSLSVLMLATSVATATLSNDVGCTGPDSSNNIDFGTILSTATPICTFTLRNQTSTSLTVGTLATSGTGFGAPQGVRTPLTLLAGEPVAFTVAFAPGVPGIYAGTLTIDARSFHLTGKAVAPVIPAPQISYDSAPLASAQQRNLTLSLSSPAPVAISGNVTISFTPDTPVVTDDPSVLFAATGARNVAYTVSQGDTQALLAGQPYAVFQTGTTSGKIRFSLSSSIAFQSDPTTILTIPPAKVSIDTAFADSRTGFVDIQLVGFDNTYSAGPMSFTFYDTGGRQLGSGASNADFTSGFRNYFAKSNVGGMFKAAITFPVSGDVTQVGAVDVQLTNSAGVDSLQRITIPQCQLNGAACVPN